jgi:choline dehydrogenase
MVTTCQTDADVGASDRSGGAGWLDALPLVRRPRPHQHLPTQRLCDTAALRPYVGAPMAPWPGKVDDAKLATFVREHAQTAFHPVGTCRMGSDDDAVVDCELRVRGLDGLRVVDASVMPRIIRGHAHAPTVMIAELAADLIRASNHEPEPGSAG